MIGEAIVFLREHHDTKRSQLAEVLECSPSHLANLESGGDPKWSDITIIAEYYGISTRFLTEYVGFKASLDVAKTKYTTTVFNIMSGHVPKLELSIDDLSAQYFSDQVGDSPKPIVQMEAAALLQDFTEGDLTPKPHEPEPELAEPELAEPEPEEEKPKPKPKRKRSKTDA